MAVQERIGWSILFLVGVLFYGSYSVLLNLCKVDGQIPFHSASVVVMIEASKLVLSVMMYFSSGPHYSSSGILRSCTHSIIYAIPAVLYAINNNIYVHAQEHMDPASSQILGNIKIVTTAVLYRLVIQRKLAWRKWCAVGLLALASMCYSGTQARHSSSGDIRKPFITVKGVLLMMTYCTLSAISGIYTEYVLKSTQTSLHLQNVQLYIYGVVLNLWAFLYSTWNESRTTYMFFDGYSRWTIVIIITQTLIGLIMSVIFKHGSNILRLFLISCSIVVNAALAMMVFGFQPTLGFWLAFAMVVLAVGLFHYPTRSHLTVIRV